MARGYAGYGLPMSDMIAEGKIDLSPMISHRVAFTQFFDAIATASDPAKSAKVMLTF